MTKDRVRDALKMSVEKSAAAAAAGKKSKTKPGDELRRSLATTITEIPPILVDHSFKNTGFDSKKKPAEILEDEALLDALLTALTESRGIVEEATSSATAKGYIFAKYRNKPEGATQDGEQTQRSDLLYEDFHPFLPNKFADDPTIKVIEFDGFNKTVDEFFSSLEGQKLESRLTEREEAAKRKLEAARNDQAKRIEGLQEVQSVNVQKATAIEANVERVQEAMDAVNGLLQQGMDWVDISKLIEREQKRSNPVAEIIKLPLNLADNTITLLLGEEEDMEDEDSSYETDSDASDSEDENANNKQKAAKQLAVDVNIALSPYANAREYYEQKRTAAKKEEKTVQQSEIALKNAEQKIQAELKKGLKQEKAVLAPIRKQIWFEKFIWFISTDGYLVLGGKDAQQNEMLYKRYLRKGDIYVHADIHGAATVIIKNTPSDPDAPIPPSTLAQAGTLAVCSSSAWDSKAGMGAWWVKADQVSKSAPTGEYLPTGSFMVRGQKNFLPPAQLLLGIGIMWKISEESKARHVKHRLYDGFATQASTSDGAPAPEEAQAKEGEEASDIGSDDDHEDEKPRDNPFQMPGQDGKDESEEKLASEESPADDVESPADEVEKLILEDDRAAQAADNQPTKSSEEEEEEEDGTDEGATGVSTPAESAAVPSSKTSTAASERQRPAKRGQKGKAKKIAAKYKDQDEEDKAAAENLYGAARGKQRADAEAQSRAQREAELAAQKERRRAQHQRQQKEIAEHEEVRRLMNEEGIEVLDAEEMGKMTLLDNLVGTPLPGDEILEAIPVCAPWNAMGKFKYKAKLQPGAVKKGKAVKEVFETWKAVSGKKGVLDERAQDKERMWPREVELIKALKAEEAFNCVPVGKVRVMMAGGSSGSGGAKGQQDKGGRGGKGSKKK